MALRGCIAPSITRGLLGKIVNKRKIAHCNVKKAHYNVTQKWLKFYMWSYMKFGICIFIYKYVNDINTIVQRFYEDLLKRHKVWF